MVKHRIEINVRDPKGKTKKVLSGGELTLRQRILTRLLGTRRMLVLVPADDVLSVSVKEVLEE